MESSKRHLRKNLREDAQEELLKIQTRIVGTPCLEEKLKVLAVCSEIHHSAGIAKHWVLFRKKGEADCVCSDLPLWTASKSSFGVFDCQICHLFSSFMSVDHV